MTRSARPKPYASIVSALALASTLALAGCNVGVSGTPPTDAKDDEPALPVETAQVVSGDVSAAYEATATLEPERQARVVAKQSGVLIELHVEEGDRVEAGQLLARLEYDRYAIQLQQTEASLRQLENELARASEMHERSLISAEAYERVRASAESQRAAHALARLELEHTEVRAPIAGVVSERMVKHGNLVAQHQALFVIDDFDALQAVLHVPERELNLLQPGQTARLHADAFPGEHFEGRIERIRPVIDAATGTFAVTATFNDPSGRLRPGLFGRVEVTHDRRENVATVPQDAVLNEDGAQSVFVLVNDDSGDGVARVERRVIRTGYPSDGRVEVIDGLSEGDIVVTAGKNSLRDGARVRIIPS